jgi:hypothetical protein
MCKCVIATEDSSGNGGNMDNFKPLTTSEGILFTVELNSKVRQCLISEEALQRLSLLKNIDSAEVSAMEIFQAFEGCIHPLARSLLKASATTGPFHLTRENITAAFGINSNTR